MNKFLHFVQYHNAIPLAVTILVMGAGATFAATDPQAIYSKTQRVVSIDNTYIVSKDLSAYTPRVEITGVTEDADNYYVAYKFSTIDLQDAVWQDIVREGTMTISKPDLGPYRDLGVYVTGQLKQIIEREMQRLAGTQEIERKNVSQKVVATTYGGLVGKFLDEKTEELPGYTPVVVPPPPAPSVAVGPSQDALAAAAASQNASQAPAPPQAPLSAESSGASSGSAPIIQILGKNPAVVPTGAPYVDLGAVVSDDRDSGLRARLFVDGAEVSEVKLDTSTSTEYAITYRATDSDGNTAEATRRVIVYDRTQPPPVVEQIPPAQVPDIQAIEARSSGSTPVSSLSSGAPVIAVKGANPATVSVGATYADLGAAITGPSEDDKTLELHAVIDGGATTTLDSIYIDTSASGTHAIRYFATDAYGRTGFASRTVNVVDLSATSTPSIPSTSSSTTSSASAPAASGTTSTASEAPTSTASTSTDSTSSTGSGQASSPQAGSGQAASSTTSTASDAATSTAATTTSSGTTSMTTADTSTSTTTGASTAAGASSTDATTTTP